MEEQRRLFPDPVQRSHASQSVLLVQHPLMVWHLRLLPLPAHRRHAPHAPSDVQQPETVAHEFPLHVWHAPQWLAVRHWTHEPPEQ